MDTPIGGTQDIDIYVNTGLELATGGSQDMQLYMNSSLYTQADTAQDMQTYVNSSLYNKSNMAQDMQTYDNTSLHVIIVAEDMQLYVDILVNNQGLVVYPFYDPFETGSTIIYPITDATYGRKQQFGAGQDTT